MDPGCRESRLSIVVRVLLCLVRVGCAVSVLGSQVFGQALMESCEGILGLKELI